MDDFGLKDYEVKGFELNDFQVAFVTGVLVFSLAMATALIYTFAYDATFFIAHFAYETASDIISLTGKLGFCVIVSFASIKYKVHRTRSCNKCTEDHDCYNCVRNRKFKF